MRTNGLVALAFFAFCGAAIYVARTGDGRTTADTATPGSTATKKGPAPAPADALEVRFSVSDGLKDWVTDVAGDFNGRRVQVGKKTVVVKPAFVKPGESVQRILAGQEKPHLWSPVSRSWIECLNSTWRLREQRDFLDETRPTVRTPIVIALWEPMARALGWPDKPIGWEELAQVATDPRGWARYGHPEWGQFKYGHGHPDYSSSAMLSVASVVYAAAHKREGLTPDDLRRPEVTKTVAELERAIVHYGETSSWLTEKLCSRGPGYLSAVTLYEQSVVKANLKFPQKAFPLVAVYPKEGTFWEDHPTGIVNASWVSDEERQGAQAFLDFMTSPEQQAKAPRYGYRPADATLPLVAPLDREHGIDPAATSEGAFRPLGEDLWKRVNALWHQAKKKSTVYVVLDTSGSMNGEPMNAAKLGCEGFLKRMEPEDEVQVIAFSTAVRPMGALAPVRQVGEPTIQAVRGLFAEGNTALYDAIDLALSEVERARATRREPRLYGIVVLTDGKDTSSRMSEQDLLAKLPRHEDSEGTRIFTIAYGADADVDFLARVADRTNAIAQKGDQTNVDRIYLSISSYF